MKKKKVLAVPPPSTKMEALERRNEKNGRDDWDDDETLSFNASLLVEGGAEGGGSRIFHLSQIYLLHNKLKIHIKT